MITGAIFMFVLFIGDFMVPQFPSGGESAITTLIYLAADNGLNYLNATVLSIVFLLVIFAVVYAMARVVDISEITQG